MPIEKDAGPGKVVRLNTAGKPIVARQRARAINTARKQAFLDHLAQCCNVMESAAAAGIWTSNLYRLRQKDPEFAEQWQDAMAAGHVTIEAMMLERARMALLAEMPDPENAKKDTENDSAKQGANYAMSMDSDQILRLLALHRRTLNGGQRGVRPKGPAASEDVACAAILKKLNVLKKRIDAGKA